MLITTKQFNIIDGLVSKWSAKYCKAIINKKFYEADLYYQIANFWYTIYLNADVDFE